jgi:nicotinamide mononucleotide transporter PnuC
MMKIKELWNYFSIAERLIWSISVFLIVTSFLIFEQGSGLTLVASLIGVTSLIFLAKGNAAGHVLMIIFCLLYGAISFGFRYYGEMMTYLGMSMPMCLSALISWVRHPYQKNQVEVHRVKRKEVFVSLILTAIVTFIFYYILLWTKTANLIPSTISVATSFFAASMMFCRSPYYSLAYAANDVVLIILWVLASIQDISYLSVVVCFSAFLLNDIYGFISWRRMEKNQRMHMES